MLCLLSFRLLFCFVSLFFGLSLSTPLSSHKVPVLSNFGECPGMTGFRLGGVKVWERFGMLVGMEFGMPFMVKDRGTLAGLGFQVGVASVSLV